MKSMEIPGQISIFEYLEETGRLLPPVEEIVNKVSDLFGLSFEPSTFLDKPSFIHRFKGCKKCEVEIHDSVYTGSGKRFVSVNFSDRTSGFGAPCDSEDEVIKHINSAIKRAETARSAE